jgi:hypothetical protein
VWSALEHFSVFDGSPVERRRLRAWLAAHAGNAAEERSALSGLVELEPGDTTALDRLTALADAAGNEREAARLQRQKAAMVSALARYRALLRGDSIGDPAELARLAEFLGRRIEADGWSLIRDQKAGQPGPSRPFLPELPPLTNVDAFPASRSLAQLFRGLRPASPRSSPAGSAPRP